MDSRVKMFISLTMATLLFASGIQGQAQEQRHVVTLAELNKEGKRVAQTRQSDEEAVRGLLSSEQGQKALKSAHFDYERVDKAVGQLSDEELARLAQRARQAKADFAAGRISNTLIVVIIGVVAAVIILAVSLPKD